MDCVAIWEDGKIKVSFPYDENNPTAWTAYSNVIIAIADRAKAAKSANTVLITPEESEMKYFCRSWLMQLGFGGADRKEDRRILLAFSLEGKPTKQIAEEMDLTDGQVRIRLHRIRSRLRKGLNDDA